MRSCVSKSNSLADINSEFWQLCQKYQDDVYRCCVKWMGGNPTDADSDSAIDALSRAMLKAWEKVQKYAGKIDNFKSWVTKLTHNLCGGQELLLLVAIVLPLYKWECNRN